MMGQTMIVKRTLLLITAMLATLIVASGVAFAVNKVCPSGSTEQNPCLGTAKSKKKSGKDLLMGTSGPDYIKALSGNDQISAGAGNDTTDGGSGNDTYSYKDGWGQDTLIDSGGSADQLNFSAVGSAGSSGVVAALLPKQGYENFVDGPNGELVNLSSGTVVEKVTGSSNNDTIFTEEGPHTLRPGPGTGGARLEDKAGCAPCSVPTTPSSDTYSGFSASGYGPVTIRDHGGTADKLVLPFASTDAYFETANFDSDPAHDNLIIMTSSTDSVLILGQLEPAIQQKGHIEQIQFTDTTMSIGSETAQAQTLSAAKTTAGSAEAQVEKLNESSSLDSAEKEKRSKAAKKIKAEAEKKAQDSEEKLAASGGEEKR